MFSTTTPGGLITIDGDGDGEGAGVAVGVAARGSACEHAAPTRRGTRKTNVRRFTDSL
jgi:hypothetical protein